MKLFFARCCILLLLTFSSQLIASNDKVIFNRPADTPQSRYIVELMTLAYKELGIDVELVDFNKNNALIAANEGILDGQLGKISGLNRTYPNLNRINVPLFSFDLNLISFCKNCQLADMPSLVIHSTYPAAAKYLSEHPYQGQLHEVKSVSTLLNLLMQKQVSAALVIGFYIEPYMHKLQNAGVELETLHSQQVYHYVHKTHKDLIPALSKVLNEFKASGKMLDLKNKYNL